MQELANAGAKVMVPLHLGRPKDGPWEVQIPRCAGRAQVRELMAGEGALHQAIASARRGRGLGRTEARRGGRARESALPAAEEENDAGFAKQLAELGDLYVNDAFSTAHRAHTSVEGITHLLPAIAGLLMMTEISRLEAALEHPARPVMAIVGGAKVSTKIEVLANLSRHGRSAVVGGGMANTFLFAEGMEIGNSLCEPVKADGAGDHGACQAAWLRDRAPRDSVAANEFKAGCRPRRSVSMRSPADQMILDMGPKSVADLKRRFAEMKTLVWNGPVGAFEFEPFGKGTFELMQAAARLVRDGKLVAIAAAATPSRPSISPALARTSPTCPRRRRLPRMAGGQDPAGRRRARGEQSLRHFGYNGLVKP